MTNSAEGRGRSHGFYWPSPFALQSLMLACVVCVCVGVPTDPVEDVWPRVSMPEGGFVEDVLGTPGNPILEDVWPRVSMPEGGLVEGLRVLGCYLVSSTRGVGVGVCARACVLSLSLAAALFSLALYHTIYLSALSMHSRSRRQNAKAGRREQG